MRHLNRGLTALATALACSLAGSFAPAQAATIQYTYTGSVADGYDHAGIFGTADSLTGEAFTLVEQFDTVNNAYRAVDAIRSLQYGGSALGQSKAATLTVTIGGKSKSIADTSDYIASDSSTGQHQDFVRDDGGYEYAGFQVNTPHLPADYGTSLVLGPGTATFVGSYQFFSRTNPARATYASFDVQSLTVQTVAAIPLPPSVFLFGGALVVVACRSRLRRERGSSGRAEDTTSF